MNDAEVARLSAGRPPARPEDDEIARILAGRPPSQEESVIATLSATSPALSAVTSSWEPSDLEGSRVIKIGRATFRIPRDAQTKYSRRAGTVWVLYNAQTYILSELGQLRQTPAERRATRWDLL